MASRAKPLRYAFAAVIAATCLVGLPATSNAQDQQPGRYPGLPFVECVPLPENVDCDLVPNYSNDFGWVNFVQVGIAGSPRAQQWARVPLAVMTNALTIGYNLYLSNPPEYQLGRNVLYDLQAFFVSPAGSADNYGLSPVVTVRTVAFGSIPTEISLQLEQQRDSNGLPYPLRATQTEQIREEIGAPGGPSLVRTLPVQLAETLNVKVLSVRLDDVTLDLSRECGTGPSAELSLTSSPTEGITALGATPWEYDGFDPSKGFYGLSGGTLSGNLAIPQFRGCTTPEGDDLSQVLTAAVSGPVNPVEILVGALSCVKNDGGVPFQRALPAAPGSTTPESINCQQTSPNPLVKTVPAPLPFPDFAPGAQP